MLVASVPHSGGSHRCGTLVNEISRVSNGDASSSNELASGALEVVVIVLVADVALVLEASGTDCCCCCCS